MQIQEKTLVALLAVSLVMNVFLLAIALAGKCSGQSPLSARG